MGDKCDNAIDDEANDLSGLKLHVPVNSYGLVEMVSSPNHTFSWANLIKQLVQRAHTFSCN